MAQYILVNLVYPISYPQGKMKLYRVIAIGTASFALYRVSFSLGIQYIANGVHVAACTEICYACC